MAPRLRSASVVVATVDRQEALAACLDGIARLEGVEVEVIVVVGPGGDATIEALTARGDVTVVSNPTRNLSRSRNLGIDAATHDVVAFLDDDAIPTQRWLHDLLPHFDDPEVGAVGGLVFDYTGHSLQARYSRCDRAGDATVVLAAPIRGLTETPAASTIDYPIGTNLVVRRRSVVEIGGFDEQYDYFHDETDLARRLLDAGWIVRVATGGAVVHRYLPSATRGGDRVATDRRSVLINRAYFAARHQAALDEADAVRRSFDAFVAHHRTEMEAAALPDDLLDRFDDHAREADELLTGWLATPPSMTAHHPDHDALVARTAVLLGGGLRPHVAVATTSTATDRALTIARALLDEGATVRVIEVDGGPHHRVDVDGGIWRHRLGDLPVSCPAELDPTTTPSWRPVAAVTAELDRICDLLWPLDRVVVAPGPLADLLARGGHVGIEVLT